MGGRGERGEEAGGERDGGGLVVAAAVVFFLSSTFLLASAAWSSSRLREIDSHGADHFRGVAQMVLAARFVGVNKTSCHFCPTKKSAGGLDKRGNLAYNHCILLLRSAPLLILLIVLTRLPLSGVRGRAVLFAGFMFDIRAVGITVRPFQHPPCPPCALSYVPCAPAASDVLLSRLGTQRSPSPRAQRHPAHPSAWR